LNRAVVGGHITKENLGHRVIIPIISISWHGGTRVLIQIANHLAGLGQKVVLLVARKRCHTPFEFAPGVVVKDVGIHTGLKWIDYPIYLLCVPFYMCGNAVCLANFFVSYYPVRLMALITRLPYLYFVQDIESKYPFPSGVILNPLCNWTYRDRRIIAANAHLKSRLLVEFGATSRNISVGPGRIFYEMPAERRKKYDVVYFLRREPWKGLDRFQRFLALAQGRLSCLCVSQDEELASSISDSDAVFRKPGDDRELVECLDSARVLLLTSYEEGFALPPLEGMARGLPTILYRCGGPDQYVVSGSNAMYVQDELEAVRVIEALINDRQQYERMSHAAKATAGEYKMDKSLTLMAEFVAQCSKW
jgi:glycosyltransferase involved in cell wall biosynthesis